MAELWHCTEDEYHADTSRVGRSMLDDFRTSWGLYHGRYVTRTIERRASSDALEFGKLLHRSILEPHRMGDVLVGPTKTRSSKAWQEMAANNPGRLIASEDEIVLAKVLGEAVRRNPVAQSLLDEDGPHEQAMWWVDAPTCLQLKTRFDKVIRGHTILDLKSTIDPSPIGFAKSSANSGYFRQAAMYIDGLSALTDDETSMAFIAIGKEPPYDVAVHELHQDDVDLGRRQLRKLLDQLARCYETDTWNPPWTARANLIRLPSWAGNESLWEVTAT